MASKAAPVPRGNKPARPVTDEQRALMDEYLVALRNGTAPIDRLIRNLGREYRAGMNEPRLTPIPMAMVVSLERWRELYGKT